MAVEQGGIGMDRGLRLLGRLLYSLCLGMGFAGVTSCTFFFLFLAGSRLWAVGRMLWWREMSWSSAGALAHDVTGALVLGLLGGLSLWVLVVGVWQAIQERSRH